MWASGHGRQSNLYNLDNLYQKDTHPSREHVGGWGLYRGGCLGWGGCLGRFYGQPS